MGISTLKYEGSSKVIKTDAEEKKGIVVVKHYLRRGHVKILKRLNLILSAEL